MLTYYAPEEGHAHRKESQPYFQIQSVLALNYRMHPSPRTLIQAQTVPYALEMVFDDGRNDATRLFGSFVWVNGLSIYVTKYRKHAIGNGRWRFKIFLLSKPSE